MTGPQLQAARKREENMRRIREMRSIPRDRTLNLRGVAQARQAMGRR